MAHSGKQCGTCFFWSRIPHMLDFELGRCALFEREMSEPHVCGMWESRVANVIEETQVSNSTDAET